MRLRAVWLVFTLGVFLSGGLACNKPAEDDCRKAVLNLQKIRGLDKNPQAPDIESTVRKCRATGNADSVRCLINAKTEAEADACQPKAK